MKPLAAGVLLATLTVCGSVGADAPAKPRSRTASAKTLPFAPPPPPISEEEGVLCAADVKQCPDGSTVSRNAAKACEFDPCPGEPKP